MDPAPSEFLRFLACGSVDDGKSTLLGRMLHDARLIALDDWAAVLREESAERPHRNELGRCELVLERRLACDRFADCGATGAMILVDRVSNATAGAA